MRTKARLFLVLSSCAFGLFACSSSKQPYQKPNLKPSDEVKVYVGGGNFKDGVVCATKTSVIGRGTRYGDLCLGKLVGFNLGQLKEGQVAIFIPETETDGQGKILDTDELIPSADLKPTKDQSKLKPPVEPNDIVLVLYGVTMDKTIIPARVVKLEGGDLYFNVLINMDVESSPLYWLKTDTPGIYKADSWYVPSPKIAESLKKL
jgi:hypothetical protein